MIPHSDHNMKLGVSKKKPETRHGKRAEGVVAITFTAPESLKADCEALAQKDDRALSAWIRLQLQSITRRSRAARKGLRVAA